MAGPGPKFAKLHAGMVKRTVAKPCKIVGPKGEIITSWHITEEAA